MLITNDYRALNETMHREKPTYGTTAPQYAGAVDMVAQEFGCRSILDYGAGKRLLGDTLGRPPVVEYDPAVPEISGIPTGKFDMVACIDVLEHIEPECVDDVMDHIESLTGKLVFLTVSCRPAAKTLPDGRNAHIMIRPPNWWLQQILPRFYILRYTADNKGEQLVAVGAPSFPGERKRNGQ